MLVSLEARGEIMVDQQEPPMRLAGYVEAPSSVGAEL